jgi:SAM-dependent methyltransferase/uncharacterized protein YbaR (Trm112 family)
MKLGLFEAVAPVCPGCRTDEASWPVRIAEVLRERPGRVDEGRLVCENPACQREYPIIDGIPVLLSTARQYLQNNLATILQRNDLSDAIESLLGDCAGPGSPYDTARQHASTYGWGHWGDLDPDEPDPGSGLVGLLERGLTLAGPLPEGLIVDLGCAAGRGTFELARRLDRPVLGIDLHWALLAIARRVLEGGIVQYPRRRVGLVYDRRRFAVDTAGSDLVDFWACDAQALPLRAGSVACVSSLNVLDCLPLPYEHLHHLAQMLAPGGVAAIATPYDWSTGATALEAWLGGHSQRGPDHGMSDTFLRKVLTVGEHPSAVPGFAILGEEPGLPWTVRLHDRARMEYSSHLLVVRRS